MRKIFFYSALIIILSCSKDNQKGYEIEANVSSDYDGKKASLVILENGIPKKIDTSVVNKGVFKFSGVAESPDMYYIELEDIRGNLPFIIENTKYNITIDRDSIFKSIVKGGEEHEALERYKIFNKSIRDRNVKLGKEVRAAQRNRDTALISVLRKTYDSLNKASFDNNIEFMNNNNENVISALILENMLPSRQLDSTQASTIFSNFSSEVKTTRAGKTIDSILKNYK